MPSPTTAKLSLSRNYRSVPALTAAVNAVFDHPCPFALPGVGYDPVESAVGSSGLAIDGETIVGGGSSPVPDSGTSHGCPGSS